jgi:diguanylate cyclase (GGDEF)-like protein
MTETLSMTVGLQCFAEGQLSTGAVVTLVILALQIGFGLVMRRRANFAGRRFFLIANVALTYWLAMATFEQWTLDPGCKVWFAALTHFGITLVPVSWVMFIHRYCFGLRGPIALWQAAALTLLPITVAAVALTSPWHGMFYAAGTGPVGDWPGAPVIYTHGVLFAVFSAVLYGFMVWSLVLLFRGLVTARKNYRVHFALLLLLTLAPLAANLGYVVADFALFDFDPTPFFFIFTSMAYAVIIMTNNHLDLVGIARKDFFDDFSSALAVIDTAGRMQAVNHAAESVMGTAAIAETLMTLVQTAEKQGGRPIEGQIITTGARALRVSLHPVLSPLGQRRQTIGWMAMVEDVTVWHAMIVVLTASLEEQTGELERSREESAQMQSLAVRDPLTGALNRRGLENALKSLLSDGTPPDMIGIALVDIDHFKQINDRFGHDAGDAVLVRFADILLRTFRRSDLVFRVGGEEFLVLGPGLDLATMAERLEDAREMLATDVHVKDAVPDEPVQFSAGLDHWTASGARTMTEVMRSVDTLLYVAKRDGRNRTVVGEAS